MYQHLGIALDNGSSNSRIAPPSTQNAYASGSGSNIRASSSAPGSSQTPASQSTQQPALHQSQPPSAPAAQPTAPNPTPPANQQAAAPNSAPPATQHQAQTPAPADEIAALRAQITELERGNAHSKNLPARAPATPSSSISRTPQTLTAYEQTWQAFKTSR
ncbi:hypothetical protein EDD22DRAFT_956209 [Suillus occidentalis]|nr:hypothetical protein EDD22DRAFT_956209 [Suillus occidentalis]